MDQRIEFVMKALVPPDFRELCREYRVSAKTGNKWRERFVRPGLAGLNELSRRPHGHAAELGEAIVCEIVRLKQAHPHWGPRKIQALYQRKHGGEVPSESSFKRVLERAGLTVRRRVLRVRGTGQKTAVRDQKSASGKALPFLYLFDTTRTFPKWGPRRRLDGPSAAEPQPKRIENGRRQFSGSHTRGSAGGATPG